MKESYGQATTFAYTPAIRASPAGVREALRLEMESRLPLFAEDYHTKYELRRRAVQHLVKPIVHYAVHVALRAVGFSTESSDLFGAEYEQMVKVLIIFFDPEGWGGSVGCRNFGRSALGCSKAAFAANGSHWIFFSDLHD